jgi:hypothetical protein
MDDFVGQALVHAESLLRALSGLATRPRCLMASNTQPAQTNVEDSLK